MKKSRVKHTAGTHYKKLDNYSRKMALNFDKEVIHNFRVEYKKLRAFTRLVNDRVHKDEIKIPKKLKKVYSIAGELRDLQLQQLRVRESAQTKADTLHGYYYLLSQEITGIKKKLLMSLKVARFNKMRKKTGAGIGQGFMMQKFPLYLQGKCREAREIIFAAPLSEGKIHSVRKLLKDLFYNLEIYRQESQFPPGTWKEKVEEYFSTLLDEMGNFQDKCAAIVLIEKHLLQHQYDLDREAMTKIQQEWVEEKISLQELLLRRLKTDVVLATGNADDIPLLLKTGL